jgi:hypothetical protein
MGGGGGGGMEDLFSELINPGGRRRKQGPVKGEDVVHRLRVSLKELYMGANRFASDLSTRMPPQSLWTHLSSVPAMPQSQTLLPSRLAIFSG